MRSRRRLCLFNGGRSPSIASRSNASATNRRRLPEPRPGRHRIPRRTGRRFPHEIAGCGRPGDLGRRSMHCGALPGRPHTSCTQRCPCEPTRDGTWSPRRCRVNSARIQNVGVRLTWSGRLDSNQRPPAPKLTSGDPNSGADIDHFPTIYSCPLTCSATHVHTPESTLEHRVSHLVRPCRSPMQASSPLCAPQCCRITQRPWLVFCWATEYLHQLVSRRWSLMASPTGRAASGRNIPRDRLPIASRHHDPIPSR
jgi:hypothetical protein